MSATTATVHIDGASRGNPGPAALAFVLQIHGEEPIHHAKTIGTVTNNVAEYSALLAALEKAKELSIGTLNVFSDSELLVKQMNGEYKVKHPDLLGLYNEARQLRSSIGLVTFTHVRRADNAEADRLCNEVLDQQKKHSTTIPKMAPLGPVPVSQPVRLGGAPEALETEAIALLNAAYAAWTQGRAEPKPVDIWDLLWTIIGEHGIHTRGGRV
jgi:ribonuclease HI